MDVDWGSVDASIGSNNMPLEMFGLLVEASVSKRSNCMSSEHQTEIDNWVNAMKDTASKERRRQIHGLITTYIQLHNEERGQFRGLITTYVQLYN
mmetsp:Transcript_14360/g.26111  ORF Transcript_14360/g.26111 Transcript_14360/m.26111 type:complete len:95 (-) Transcript_14360:351-635(-)